MLHRGLLSVQGVGTIEEGIIPGGIVQIGGPQSRSQQWCNPWNTTMHDGGALVGNRGGHMVHQMTHLGQ